MNIKGRETATQERIDWNKRNVCTRNMNANIKTCWPTMMTTNYSGEREQIFWGRLILLGQLMGCTNSYEFTPSNH